MSAQPDVRANHVYHRSRSWRYGWKLWKDILGLECRSQCLASNGRCVFYANDTKIIHSIQNHYIAMNNDADSAQISSEPVKSGDAVDTKPADDIRELIIVPKHGTPDDIERVLNQISRVCNALVSRILIGSVKESITIGAANPVVQQIFQCAASSGTALGMMVEQRRQRSQVLVPQMGTPRMGRA